MLFQEPHFLFCFLPIALLLYRGALYFRRDSDCGDVARACLFFLTLFFYGFRHPAWLAPFFVSVVFDFGWARFLHHVERPSRRRAIVAASVVQNLFLLFAFRYRVSDHGFWRWGIPAGISFYTFESMSFVIDVYRRKIEAPRNPWRFLGFIAMFPRFLAGPIARFQEVDDQSRRHRGMEIENGLFLFAYGLFLKLALADFMAPLVDAVFGFPDASFADAWIGAVAFTLQIYFDFCGYSWMATGLGRCFGYSFPLNFDRPYGAASFQEFWRRWHCSLSGWLRDYVYVPLGGSHRSQARTSANLFATMALCGLWHGFGWTFFLWGCSHGALLMGERWLRFPLKRLPVVAAKGIVFIVVTLTFVLFRAPSVAAAGNLLSSMAIPNGLAAPRFFSVADRTPLVAMAFALALFYLLVIERHSEAAARRSVPFFWERLVTAAMGVAAILVGLSRVSVPFLYFQF